MSTHGVVSQVESTSIAEGALPIIHRGDREDLPAPIAAAVTP